MPYIANTPESSPRATRLDSRHPQATCKGITSEGRPCKRNLACSSINAQQAGQYVSAEELYCWQHKQQAKSSVYRSTTANGSIDTLVERLKLDKPPIAAKPHATGKEERQPPNSHRRRQKSIHHSQPSLFARLCCITFDDDWDNRVEIVRHKDRVHRRHAPNLAPDSNHDAATATATKGSSFHPSIPKALPMQVKVQLQTELLKPISEFDEDGYIYMYRKISMPADESGTSAILQEKHGIGFSDLPQASPNGADKILVKIGYTSNVQRRLSTWSGKCRSQIELLRYYPHTSSRSSECQPRKTPYCRKVERLVHLELGHRRVRQPCICGSVHREWFEIDASMEAIRSVDGVIQRWVSWAELQGKVRLP